MIRERYNWGDQEDGTYCNPILQGDFSDPDIIRHGEKFYMISSTFQFHPGMVILESIDLVNWVIVGSVINNLAELDENLNWDKMNAYGDGVYAGAIRYLQWKDKTEEGKLVDRGRWFVYTTIYSRGILVSTAENIKGPWTTQFMKDYKGRELKVSGWDDNCPYWEHNQDGTLKLAYMIASKVNGAWYPHIFQMSLDGLSLLDGDLDYMGQKGDFTREREDENTVTDYMTGEKISCTAGIGDANKAAFTSHGELLSVTRATINQGREGTVIRDIYTGEASKIISFSPDTQAGNARIKTRHGKDERVADYIYIFQSEVWPEEDRLVRMPFIHRAKCIYGDRFDNKGNYLGPGSKLRPGSFESQRLMINQNVPFDDLEPNQGGYVDIPKEMAGDGKEHWYFITHHGKEHVLPWCRPVSLLPVEWVNGWPIPGEGGSIPGVMQYHLNMPPFKRIGKKTIPQQSDNFYGNILSPFWQWNHVPCEAAYSLSVRENGLRLYAFPTADESDSFFKIPNVLSQRYLYGKQLGVEVSFELAGMEIGQEAGLAHFNGGNDSCRIGVCCFGDRQLCICLDGEKYKEIPKGTSIMRLYSEVDAMGNNRYSYGLDKGTYYNLHNNPYKLKPGGYRGDSIGIYTFQTKQKRDGYIDIISFQYKLTNS